MPSAMSRPSEPVETVSTSIDCMFLPRRMIEPLPKLRSICDSAASRAFDLSMDDPSTRRSAALMSRMSQLTPIIVPEAFASRSKKLSHYGGCLFRCTVSRFKCLDDAAEHPFHAFVSL